MKEGTVAARAYDNQELIQERHRHRFEFNNQYRAEMEAKGLVFSGTSPDNHLVEVIEIPDKRFLRCFTVPSRIPFTATTSGRIIQGIYCGANQSK